MVLRKLMAVLMVVVFVAVAIPALMINSLVQSFLNPVFYTDVIDEKTYDFVVGQSSGLVYENSQFVRSSFDYEEVENEVRAVYTKTLFDEMMKDLGRQIMDMRSNSAGSIALDLTTLKISLGTVANNLTYRVYLQLPACADDFGRVLNDFNFPICVRDNVGYDRVVKPFLDEFGRVIQLVVPDRLENLDSVLPDGLIANIVLVRNLLFGVMIALLGVIALILYHPFWVMVKYEGWAFLSSGIAGLLLAVGVYEMTGYVIGSLSIEAENAERVREYLRYLFGYLSSEIQVLALMFLVVGVSLIMMSYFLKTRNG